MMGAHGEGGAAGEPKASRKHSGKRTDRVQLETHNKPADTTANSCGATKRRKWHRTRNSSRREKCGSSDVRGGDAQCSVCAMCSRHVTAREERAANALQ